jgi:hypothetical protein
MANGPKAAQAKGISKMEAVRRALAHFGRDAAPSQMQPWIKSEFGIAMTPSHISAYKGKLLAKARGNGRPAAKAAAPKPAAAASAAAPKTGAAPANGISKIEGVKRAMAELGPDAKPLAIKDYLKSRFGVEISGDVVSTYKKTVAKRGKTGRKPAATKGRPPAPKAVAATPQAPATAPRAASGAGVSLEDLGAVKHLVGRVGADGLRALIDLFAR